MSDFSFYWHDYETFGADPARDRPSQFAGLRTDADFNIIGEPLVIYCQPAPDALPHPEACLITGITPQQAQAEGLPEYEFIRRIHAELARPGTCAVGYNSIRFDDEVTRHTLYRNFYDPYAREWQGGNSRWDIIDMVRVCRALRPEGIEWPEHEDGTPSFKLEHLTAANGIAHEAAHDALSDVHATIAMARLIKEKQPKLFEYLLQLRGKKQVQALLDVSTGKPVLHTSAMFPARNFCTTLVMPLAMHPQNKNGVICYDLREDPSELLSASAEDVKRRLFTPTAELAEGETRIALKTVHINRCPVVATSRLLDEAAAERINLDMTLAKQHYQQLREAMLVEEGGLGEKLQAVFRERQFAKQTDPDCMLYGGAFFSDKDKQTFAVIRGSSAEDLRDHSYYFEDSRLPEMLFRYRARNFPDSLRDEERLLWEEYCYQRLTEPEAGASITMEDYQTLIQERLAQESLSERDRKILQSLLDYGDQLLA